MFCLRDILKVQLITTTKSKVTLNRDLFCVESDYCEIPMTRILVRYPFMECTKSPGLEITQHWLQIALTVQSHCPKLGRLAKLEKSSTSSNKRGSSHLLVLMGCVVETVFLLGFYRYIIDMAILVCQVLVLLLCFYCRLVGGGYRVQSYTYVSTYRPIYFT